jgi:hypothetical protein
MTANTIANAIAYYQVKAIAYRSKDGQKKTRNIASAQCQTREEAIEIFNRYLTEYPDCMIERTPIYVAV